MVGATVPQHLGCSYGKFAVPSTRSNSMLFHCCYPDGMRRDIKVTQWRAAVLNPQLLHFPKHCFLPVLKLLSRLILATYLDQREKTNRNGFLIVRSTLTLITVAGDSTRESVKESYLQVGAEKQTARPFSSVFTSITGLLALEHKCATCKVDRELSVGCSSGISLAVCCCPVQPVYEIHHLASV